MPRPAEPAPRPGGSDRVSVRLPPSRACGTPRRRSLGLCLRWASRRARLFFWPRQARVQAWSPARGPCFARSMLNDSRQLEELRALVAPVCAAHGLELCDARFVTDHGPVLRVLIERPGDPTGGAGVSLADCQAVSRDLSTVLDVESAPLPVGRYRLEVGSPGARPTSVFAPRLTSASRGVRSTCVRAIRWPVAGAIRASCAGLTAKPSNWMWVGKSSWSH